MDTHEQQNVMLYTGQRMLGRKARYQASLVELSPAVLAIRLSGQAIDVS